MVMISPSSHNQQRQSRQHHSKQSTSVKTKLARATIAVAIGTAILVPGSISLAWVVFKCLSSATPCHRPEFWSHLWINLGEYALLGAFAGWVIGWRVRRTGRVSRIVQETIKASGSPSTLTAARAGLLALISAFAVSL